MTQFPTCCCPHSRSDIVGDRALQRSFWDDPRLSAKVRNCCSVARAAGYRYVWIDTCCIDKTSSSELSEAINSMYLWYQTAAVCYAFLADVPDRSSLSASGSTDNEPRGAPASSFSEETFRRSRWFRR